MMDMTTETSDLERAAQVAMDLHHSTLDSKLLKNRIDRWDIFATRMQSAAESAETFPAFLEAFARKLEVGSLRGETLATEIRRDGPGLLRCFREEAVSVVALLRCEIDTRREARNTSEMPLFGDEEESA